MSTNGTAPAVAERRRRRAARLIILGDGEERAAPTALAAFIRNAAVDHYLRLIESTS